MRLQRIKSLDGKDEYVLLPVAVYRALKGDIEDQLARAKGEDDYVPFALEDYLDNPVALARVKARLTQEQLAQRMGVTQAYVSKIERADSVSAKVLEGVNRALAARGKSARKA